ncbi:LOW QUALITY PROTEIN: DNA polymerase iota-like [Porphyrio hochstetteri]
MAAAARCSAPGAGVARAAFARFPLPRPSPGTGVSGPAVSGAGRGLERPERPTPGTIESAGGGTERPRRAGREGGKGWEGINGLTSPVSLGAEGCLRRRGMEEAWSPVPSRPASGQSKPGAGRSRGCRVVVHVDLDCFYAQVEMIRHPELREKPLGVQQKNIVVTCNYEARKVGVKKLMAVRDAKEKCPQLVLVNGEDLTPYREMSYKVTELLGEFCPLVERLGFDENFVDITEIVEKRLKQLEQRECSGISVSGHVYNNHAINLEDPTHLSLIIGSQVAEEFREAIHAKLGLTGCAGVASNKLLAKLVSGTHKPNQQTVLLPESSPELLEGLENIQKLPGIGYKTSKRLEMLGVRKVCELQAFPSAVLEKELGVSLAQRIQKLSWGEDESPVVPSGPPQSFSDEDSFKKCSSEVEVKEKIQELLPSLLDRIQKDGRQPHTVRLSIRQCSAARWWQRESRQCPVPPHLIQRLGKESSVVPPLTELLMKLFRKMIDGTQPFHLTLLSICFSNLKALPSSKRGSIGFYLKPTSPLCCGKRGWH